MGLLAFAPAAAVTDCTRPAADTEPAWSAQRAGEVEANGRSGQLGGYE
jgi:hypothetical protein